MSVTMSEAARALRARGIEKQRRALAETELLLLRVRELEALVADLLEAKTVVIKPE